MSLSGSKTVLAIMLSVLLVVLSMMGCQPAESMSAEPEPANGLELPAIKLETERATLVDGRVIELEIGLLSVPENRAAPGRSIQIEVARVRRQASADPATPPIFFLPGGPGFPGVRSMLGWDSTPAVVDLLTSVSDLVIVGQRGIGASIPALDCTDRLSVEVSQAGAQRRLGEIARTASEQCRSRWLSEGVDLASYSVLEAASDVRDVAEALNYPQITLWGISFGSHWSMTVMRYHPDIVSRAILSGLEGPDHTYDMPSYVVNSLRRMSLEANEAPELAAFTPNDGWLSAFLQVIKRLEEEPVTVSIGEGDTRQDVYLDGNIVRGAALGYTSSISSRRGMVNWPADILRLVKGDYRVFAEAVAARADQGLPSAAFFTLDCASSITAEREAQLDADPGQTVLGNLSRLYQSACPVWHVDLGDEFRTGFSTTIPTLLVHGTYDVNTPYDNSLELLPAFDRGHLVTVDGGSHGALQEALGADPAFRMSVMRFVSSGEMEGLPDRVVLDDLEWQVPLGGEG